jgi:alkylation response protein AidB-like acyl-CoA dehydrogenase
MNFDYSDEQKFVKDEARKFLARACPTSAVRVVAEDQNASYDRSLWKAIADMGWLAITIPERYEGLGLGRIDVCAVAEELGRAIAPVPFASTVYLFAEALLHAGSEAQRTRLLPALAKGNLIGCFATSERSGPIRPDTLLTSVTDGRLSGTKIPVTDGDVADHAIVLAVEKGRPALYLVNLAENGVTRQRLKTLDPTRGASILHFDRVSAERLEAASGDTAALLWALFDRGAAFISFEQLGGADRCLEMARDYALERYAFGRPIGSYQAIKHKLADMYIRNQIARSNAYYAAWAFDSGGTNLARAAAAARVASSDAYWYATKEAIEIFGGLGTTWQSDCHLYYRRAKQLALMVGAPALWKERLVAELERGEAA